MQLIATFDAVSCIIAVYLFKMRTYQHRISPTTLFLLLFLSISLNSYWLLAQNSFVQGELKNTEDANIYIVLHKQYFCYQPQIVQTELQEGQFFQTIPLEKPTVAYLHCGQQVLQVFLHPNDTLYINADARDLLSTVRYSGRNNNDNNLLAIFNRDFLSQESPDELAEKYKNIGESQFVETTQQNRKTQSKFLTQFKKKNSISPAFENYISTLIDYQYANALMTFPAYKSYYSNQSFKPSSSKYYNFLEKMVVSDSSKLICFDYANFLKLYIYHLQGVDIQNFTNTLYPAFYPKLYGLAQSKLSHLAREHTQALLLSEALKSGANSSVEALVVDFQKNTNSVAYQKAFNQHLEQFKRLRKGEAAPSFSLPDIKGNIKTLQSFKNKVVYISFWASWCEPCRDEISFANKLQKNIQDEDFVMLYISLDENDTEWRAAVQDLEIDGVHLGEKSLYGIVPQLFAVDRLPAHILIDRAGRIVDSHAKRPSQKGLLEDIRQLLHE